jgi:hypothetical protein
LRTNFKTKIEKQSAPRIPLLPKMDSPRSSSPLDFPCFVLPLPVRKSHGLHLLFFATTDPKRESIAPRKKRTPKKRRTKPTARRAEHAHRNGLSPAILPKNFLHLKSLKIVTFKTSAPRQAAISRRFASHRQTLHFFVFPK